MAKPLNCYVKSLAGTSLLKNLFIGFLGFVLLFLFIWGWEAYTQNTSGQDLLKTLKFGESLSNDFWLIMGIVLTGPLLEELVFRWLIYTAFRDLAERFISKPFAIGSAAIISSVLFVSIHGTPEQASQVLPLLVMGVVLSLIYQVTNSLISVFFAHALNNASLSILACLS